MEMAGEKPCFACFQRRIELDLSPELVVRYGVGDSALPFGTAAVVQIHLSREPNGIESEEVSTQVMLVGLINDENSVCDSLENDLGNFAHSKEEMSSPEGGQHQSDPDSRVMKDDTSVFGDENIREGLVSVDLEDPTVSFGERFPYPRMIERLSPFTYVGKGSYARIAELVCNYLSGSIEDFLILCLNQLVEGKQIGQHSAAFLNLIGCPALTAKQVSSSVRHPNISPVLGILGTPGYNYLLHVKAPYTLENILHYSPKALKSDWHIRFLIYQILCALTYIHDLGFAHGNICPSSIMLTDSCWAWLSIGDMRLLKSNSRLKAPYSASNILCCMEHCPCRAIFADLKLKTSMDWHLNFKQWWVGELSNFEYLLLLNRLAGRRWGDHTFHTVMPWVIDFSVKPDENSDSGWRDLKKSKWRLAKGDEQLDFTYSTSDVPHHISDECLSELAVCSYKARRLPLKVLCSAVRSVYEPNEYPSNMQRLYQWTPDECIPEFYSDPQIFVSLHSGMNDLAVPYWASSPEEFISLHRDALESDRVSRNIHHWIDITFGHKLSGQESILAKNVMLPTSDPSKPRSMGRRQLFTRPHPMRRGVTHPSFKNEDKEACDGFQKEGNKNKTYSGVASDIAFPLQSSSAECILSHSSYMEDLEEATSFCEHARYSDPVYSCDDSFVKTLSIGSRSEYLEIDASKPPLDGSRTSPVDLGCLLECLEADESGSIGFQELLHWRHRSPSSGSSYEDLAGDIFSMGCIMAELYMKKPLFDPVSIRAYKESGILPNLVHELPLHVALLVEASIESDWHRRPSAKCFLESQFFPSSIRSAYMFVAPLQIIAKTGNRLRYAAKLASAGALKAMGAFAAEMCAPYCLPLIISPLSDVETESALCLLKEFLKSLNSEAIKAMILPTIEKILQASEYSHLKVSLLQISFVRDLWKRLGKQPYLEKIHPLVISNLYNSPNKISASAASVLLIGSSEELGIPVTVHQTILPLIHSFGKGLCPDGVDALVRIGGLLGENFIIKHLLPLLRSVVLSCLENSRMNKPEPLHSWNSLALIDSFSTLDGILSVLPSELVVKEFIEDHTFLHVKTLMQAHIDLPVVQVAATALIAVCQKIGPDYSVLHVMPHLKELFDELTFSEVGSSTSSDGRNPKNARSRSDENANVHSRMDLMLLLYPSLAAFIGIDRLRQCCSTWLLLEQVLERHYNWKWDSTGKNSRIIGDYQRFCSSNITSSEYNPAKLLLNGVGWFMPQSQGLRGGMHIINSKQADEHQHSMAQIPGNHEPWFWFLSPAANWDGLDFLGRIGGPKDEIPWKIKASVVYSARAHPGVLRSLAVCHDECTVYTGGVGPGFKGSVQKWELPRMNCVSGYYGHDEVVNTICLLSLTGRVASCDGTIHIWNGQTGKLIAAYAEPSSSSPHLGKVNTEQNNMLTPNIASGGILSTAFSSSLYTCMHYLDSSDMLVAGTGNGSLRFIDVVQTRQLHFWKSNTAETSFSSLVSAICSCGPVDLHTERAVNSPSWIAVGSSSGYCRLLDARSGNIICHWRAHDGYVTKLAAPEDYLLVSSSLDKTLRLWDLRRNLATQSNVFRGHFDGISSFSVWGQNVISVSRNKIALSSLSRWKEEGGQQWVSPQKLFSADRGTRNLSVLSTISVLPFSRLFLVGTEDGYLKVCC